jgi:large subunit ribosomal protein L9
MKLVLRKDIDKLGLCGDVVEVSEGYARNYLLPHHLALEPTKGNLKAIETDKRLAAAERERKRQILVAVIDHLKGVEVTISAACTPEGHLYGSVGPREISRALMDEGHSIHADQIKMSTNIKEIGTLEVSVVLADDLRTTVKVWVVKEKTAEDLEREQQAGETDVTSANSDVDAQAGAAAE